jgi:NB-ARC domain-containing protein
VRGAHVSLEDDLVRAAVDVERHAGDGEAVGGSAGCRVGGCGPGYHRLVGNVPLELTSFVGRGRELSEIKRLLAVARAITLTGPGGIGKSRLALRAAHKLTRHFPDGVWLVELTDLDSADLLPYALARSMSVHERHGDAIEDALAAHLRERRLLLVLDNCEHLLDACRELVASVVSSCAAVRVLCTSRQRLGIPGETVVVVSALEVPAAAEPVPVAGLADVEALRLLVDRAVAVAPDFALTDGNRDATSEICRRLDGLPLAIELAAVRLASMTPADILERLGDRFRLLASDHGLGRDCPSAWIAITPARRVPARPYGVRAFLGRVSRQPASAIATYLRALSTPYRCTSPSRP